MEKRANVVPYLPDVIEASSTGDQPMGNAPHVPVQCSKSSTTPVILGGNIKILQSSQESQMDSVVYTAKKG